MRYDFAVVGANGMQGRIVSRDLTERGFAVLLCATDDYGLEGTLEHDNAEFAAIDLFKMERVRRVLKNSGAHVLVNCATDDFNLGLTKLALELGMHYIDLGSEELMLREQQKLHEAFQEANLLAVTGIGSTPGINNVMLRHVAGRFDTIHTVHLGFAWNSNMPVFVAPFSIDAIAYEFTEPAKMLLNGKFVEKMPDEDTGIEYSYKGIGKQRTCYTKHIEHHTFHDFLKDKGIKNVVVYSSFPPHSYDTIQMLIKIGFLSKEPIELNGRAIRPLDFTMEAVRHIPLPKGYVEKEDIWLKVFGTKGGKPHKEEMNCIAETRPGWEDAGCNIDTGFPASILAQMIHASEIAERGVYSPEFILEPETFFERLAERDLWVYHNGRKVNGRKQKVEAPVRAMRYGRIPAAV